MKYSQFLEVARRAEGFAELQKFFLDYTGLKDLILKIELMKQGQVVDVELEKDLRAQFMKGLAADIEKIDKVASQLIQKLNLSKTTQPSPHQIGKQGDTTVDVKMSVEQGDTGIDVTYRKALLIKQYCELNAEGVRKIAKKYDKRAGGVNEQERCIGELKGRAFGDGAIDRIVENLESDLVSTGQVESEDEMRALVAKEGMHVTGAADKDVGTVQKFLRVLSTVLMHGPDEFGLFPGLSEPHTKLEVSCGEKDCSSKDAVDKWALKEMKSTGKQWSEKTCVERVHTVLFTISKLVLVALLLYMFIISLGLMGNAFKVLGGKTSGKAFRQSELFNNPVAGLALGILATVLVQSSSTSTSVIITMAAADLISMKNSVPMIMGANIGTSVTASIVSVAHVGDRDQYRRAFGGAVVHYCFNVLTVSILLPLEVFTGMIQSLAESVVSSFGITNDDEKGKKQDFLKIITKPISSVLIQVDKKLVTKIAEESDPDVLAKLEKQSIIKQGQSNDNHLFMDTPLSDNMAGVLLIIVSLLFLSVCLMLLVKTLQSIFRGRAAIWIGKFLNLEFKRVPFIGDYILMVFGMGLTILMQSSSVTTSALTPLVGIGLIRVEKMFPFTIGANIGTTVTGILAALASSNMVIGMQVAMSHLLFNGFGTLIWFMVPAMRAVPLSMAKFLGNLASDVQLFPVFLIVFAWVMMPGLLLGLSIAGVAAVAVVGGAILFVSLVLIVIIFLRAYYPEKLPRALSRNAAWLPPTLRVEGLDGDLEQRPSSQAGGAETAEGPIDADMGKSGSWWQSPLAWGSGWLILMMLLVAVPNCQWGNLKYPKFDGRDHVGIGAWQACSAMFEEETAWAPSRAECTQADLQTCASITGCSAAGFADVKGSNADYEKSWLNCRTKCSPSAWEAHCLSMGCGGSLHTAQCNNVTKAVNQNYQVTYSSSTDKAWVAGARCRDLSELCDNGAQLGQAGSFGWAGFAFLGLGQLLLIAFGSMSKGRKVKALMASLAFFVLGWICLLASWASFASAVSGNAKCTVMDASNTGAVVATGSFGDIINDSGSYSYFFIILSWALTTLVVGVVAQRAWVEVSKAKAAEVVLEASI